MKHIFSKIALIAFCGFMAFSCGTAKKAQTVEPQTEVHYIDSTVINYKDSTIMVEVPVEVYRDYTGLLDTLRLETSIAEAWAVADTASNSLKGEIANKSGKGLTKVVYLPSEEHIVYRDSIVTKEVPVEVQVVKTHYPKSYWGLLTWFILSILLIGFKIYMKLKK